MAGETDTGIQQLPAFSPGGGPGALLVFSAGRPLEVPFPIPDRGVLELQRGLLESVSVIDTRVSRNHARVELNGGTWRVTDCGSKNATFVDGAITRESVSGKGLRVVRVGESIFLLVPEIGPHLEHRTRRPSGLIQGPKLRETWELIEELAKKSETLHITGESGAGKELAARAFHQASPHRDGPFVAVNCASIPAGVAERLLFGARKGAYSGAVADTDGYVQHAHQGVLFLDEIGDLELDVQAKLLRVLELREVTPLGGTKPRKVDFRLCSATHRDLRELVSAGKFRGDLLYRVARPSVTIPPLRARLDEIPFHVNRALAPIDKDLVPSAAFVEACLLRHWPGNVRELTAEVQNAAQAARARKLFTVDESLLGEQAGQVLEPKTISVQVPAVAGRKPLPSEAEITEALRQANGKVLPAARALGVHRNQLRTWLRKMKYQTDSTDDDDDTP